LLNPRQKLFEAGKMLDHLPSGLGRSAHEDQENTVDD
jgi:hypothetical protein